MMVDRATRWPVAIPIKEASVNQWIARFGVPAHITSDRGVRFTSAPWTQMAKFLGVKLHHTTAYHPQSNRLVERFHKHLKASLMARLSGPDWADKLPWVLLGIRTAPKEDLQASVVEMVYGAPLSLLRVFQLRPRHHGHRRKPAGGPMQETGFPGSPTPNTPWHLANPPPQRTRFGSVHFCAKGPHSAPLQRPYEGPYKVLHRTGGTFTLDIGGKEEPFMVDRLKAAHLDLSQLVHTAVPKCRGWPPKRQDAWPVLGGGLCDGAHPHGEPALLVLPRGGADMGKWHHQRFLSDSSIPSIVHPGQ
ncbi:uncharacterized protein [Narcine bancroftii]|uniref:uncharacterized protein n=1 Tax=Narcine bancroftii TaxID=1343680 RepID=UPI003831098D